jgi:hypothetical protein
LAIFLLHPAGLSFRGEAAFLTRVAGVAICLHYIYWYILTAERFFRAQHILVDQVFVDLGDWDVGPPRMVHPSPQGQSV